MPRTCTICGHKKRSAIEKAILSGEGLRTIAGRWSVSRQALARHRDDHLSAAVVKANGAAEVTRGDDLLAKLESIEVEARGILKASKRAKDWRAAIAAVRELTRLLDLLARLRGELQNAPTTINVQVLAPVILSALEGFPEARLAVAEKLTEIDQKGEFT